MCTLYERINELCKKKGVSGSRMCLDLGMSKSTLSDLKSGRKKSFTIDTAKKIASYLGVSVEYLSGEEKEKEKEPIVEDEFSESRKKLIDFAESVPEDKIDLVLRVMQSIAEGN